MADFIASEFKACSVGYRGYAKFSSSSYKSSWYISMILPEGEGKIKGFI